MGKSKGVSLRSAPYLLGFPSSPRAISCWPRTNPSQQKWVRPNAPFLGLSRCAIATFNELADLLFAAETDRVFADSGHSLDFINKAFECLDLIG